MSEESEERALDGSEPPTGAITTAADGVAGVELCPFPPATGEGPSAGKDAVPELLDWGSIDDEDGAFGQLSEAGMIQDLDLCPHCPDGSQEGGMGTAAAPTIGRGGKLQDMDLPEPVVQRMAVRQATAEGLSGAHAERTAAFNEPAPATSQLGVPTLDLSGQSTTHCTSTKLPEASESSARQPNTGEPQDGRRAMGVAAPVAAEARSTMGPDAAVLPSAADGIDGQQAAVRETQLTGVTSGEEDINASATPTAEGSTHTCNGPKVTHQVSCTRFVASELHSPEAPNFPIRGNQRGERSYSAVVR